MVLSRNSRVDRIVSRRVRRADSSAVFAVSLVALSSDIWLDADGSRWSEALMAKSGIQLGEKLRNAMIAAEVFYEPPRARQVLFTRSPAIQQKLFINFLLSHF